MFCLKGPGNTELTHQRFPLCQGCSTQLLCPGEDSLQGSLAPTPAVPAETLLHSTWGGLGKAAARSCAVPLTLPSLPLKESHQGWDFGGKQGVRSLLLASLLQCSACILTAHLPPHPELRATLCSPVSVTCCSPVNVTCCSPVPAQPALSPGQLLTQLP